MERRFGKPFNLYEDSDSFKETKEKMLDNYEKDADEADYYLNLTAGITLFFVVILIICILLLE